MVSKGIVLHVSGLWDMGVVFLVSNVSRVSGRIHIYMLLISLIIFLYEEMDWLNLLSGTRVFICALKGDCKL